MRILGLVLVLLLATVVAAWVIGGLLADREMQRVGEEAWPADLGTLASVETRFPPQKTNDAARRLVTLAAPLGISFERTATNKNDPLKTAIGEYVKHEQVRGEASIGEPPAPVAAYLADHETEIDALRDHLLHGEAIVWDRDISKGFDAPIPNLLGQMNVSRLFTARALVRGRAGDVRAWDDLHAAWRIAQNLEPRPELISQLIVLAIVRSVNAVAWKLPAANAVWLAELQKLDLRRLLLGGFQYDMWIMWEHGGKGSADALSKPYVRWSVVSMARQQRATAQELAEMTVCGFDGAAFAQRRLASIPRWNTMSQIATPNLDALWQRTFRTLAEREATMNAMRIAEGQPIVAKSVCSDGTWRFENDRLSFSVDLPKSSETEPAMPLSLAIPARAIRRSI